MSCGVMMKLIVMMEAMRILVANLAVSFQELATPNQNRIVKLSCDTEITAAGFTNHLIYFSLLLLV
jgi:hypothetical protein